MQHPMYMKAPYDTENPSPPIPTTDTDGTLYNRGHPIHTNQHITSAVQNINEQDMQWLPTFSSTAIDGNDTNGGILQKQLVRNEIGMRRGAFNQSPMQSNPWKPTGQTAHHPPIHHKPYVYDTRNPQYAQLNNFHPINYQMFSSVANAFSPYHQHINRTANESIPYVNDSRVVEEVYQPSNVHRYTQEVHAKQTMNLQQAAMAYASRETLYHNPTTGEDPQSHARNAYHTTHVIAQQQMILQGGHHPSIVQHQIEEHSDAQPPPHSQYTNPFGQSIQSAHFSQLPYQTSQPHLPHISYKSQSPFTALPLQTSKDKQTTTNGSHKTDFHVTSSIRPPPVKQFVENEQKSTRPGNHSVLQTSNIQDSTILERKQDVHETATETVSTIYPHVSAIGYINSQLDPRSDASLYNPINHMNREFDIIELPPSSRYDTQLLSPVYEMEDSQHFSLKTDGSQLIWKTPLQRLNSLLFIPSPPTDDEPWVAGTETLMVFGLPRNMEVDDITELLIDLYADTKDESLKVDIGRTEGLKYSTSSSHKLNTSIESPSIYTKDYIGIKEVYLLFSDEENALNSLPVSFPRVLDTSGNSISPLHTVMPHAMGLIRFCDEKSAQNFWISFPAGKQIYGSIIKVCPDYQSHRLYNEGLACTYTGIREVESVGDVQMVTACLKAASDTTRRRDTNCIDVNVECTSECNTSKINAVDLNDVFEEEFCICGEITHCYVNDKQMESLVTAFQKLGVRCKVMSQCSPMSVVIELRCKNLEEFLKICVHSKLYRTPDKTLVYSVMIAIGDSILPVLFTPIMDIPPGVSGDTKEVSSKYQASMKEGNTSTVESDKVVENSVTLKEMMADDLLSSSNDDDDSDSNSISQSDDDSSDSSDSSDEDEVGYEVEESLSSLKDESVMMEVGSRLETTSKEEMERTRRRVTIAKRTIRRPVRSQNTNVTSNPSIDNTCVGKIEEKPPNVEKQEKIDTSKLQIRKKPKGGVEMSDERQKCEGRGGSVGVVESNEEEMSSSLGVAIGVCLNDGHVKKRRKLRRGEASDVSLKEKGVEKAAHKKRQWSDEVSLRRRSSRLVLDSGGSQISEEEMKKGTNCMKEIHDSEEESVDEENEKSLVDTSKRDVSVEEKTVRIKQKVLKESMKQRGGRRSLKKVQPQPHKSMVCMNDEIDELRWDEVDELSIFKRLPETIDLPRIKRKSIIPEHLKLRLEKKGGKRKKLQ